MRPRFALGLLIVGAGVASCLVTYHLGREALQEVSQPATDPTTNGNEWTGQAGTLVLLRESDIIALMKARMQQVNVSLSNSPPAARPSRPPSPANPVLSPSPSAPPTSPAPVSIISPSPASPALITYSGGVSLQVNSIQQQSGYLQLQLTLRNQGNQEAQFSNLGLVVTNDQGEELSARSQGLPANLPPHSSPYPYLVRIPLALVDRSKVLGLSLVSDDQRVQLELPAVPVRP